MLLGPPALNAVGGAEFGDLFVGEDAGADEEADALGAFEGRFLSAGDGAGRIH